MDSNERLKRAANFYACSQTNDKVLPSIPALMEAFAHQELQGQESRLCLLLADIRTALNGLTFASWESDGTTTVLVHNPKTYSIIYGNETIVSRLASTVDAVEAYLKDKAALAGKE